MEGHEGGSTDARVLSAPVADVDGRRVVITGAGRGLGRWLARAFSAQGAYVALVARTKGDLEEVAKEADGPCLVLPGDVRSATFNDEVADAVVAEWGGLDVWIANAGVSPIVAGPADTDPEVWREILDTNLTGVFLGARAAARVMGEGGRIVVTGSVIGQRPVWGLSAYTASKAGLIGLVQSLALDLGPAGITANLVALGWFDSDLARPWQTNPARENQVLSHTVLHRWGMPADLPGMFLFLASRASGYVTGAVIPVDGGYLVV